MDVNGVRFHLVQGEADWEERLEQTGVDGFVYDSASRSLTLEPVVERFRTAAAVTLLTADVRRGADADRYGNWYWIDEDRRRIRILPCGSTRSELFWDVDRLTGAACADQGDGDDSIFRAVSETPAPLPSLRLSGLAITDRHYMVTGTLNPAGLLVFDLHAGGSPALTPWPEPIVFQPYDITAAARGGVWILDRGGNGFGGRYWRLDSWLRPMAIGGLVEIAPAQTDTFAPSGEEPDGVAARRFPAAFSISASSPVEAEAPRAIVGLPDDSVLVLDTPQPADHSRIMRLRSGRLTSAIALDAELLGDDIELPATILAHDMTFIPEKAPVPGMVKGRLYVAGVDGNQAFAFDLEADGDRLELIFRAEQLPLRRFGGKGLECAGGSAWYDLGDRWMPLTVHPRRRYFERASFQGLVFDGKVPDCHWRRLMLDACIPNGATIEIESRVANEEDDLGQAIWRREPTLYRRADGPEIPLYEPFSDHERDSSAAGTWETVFQSARGRFLELRLTMSGGGRLTPRLRALRVYYPAFSYLDRYLPAVYREDPVSSSFLDRYLANAEGLLTGLEARIAAAEGLFDPRIAPPEYLDWLSGWFGSTLDPDWDEARRRLFLAYAHLLFRWRGTPGGLLAMIRLATDPCPDESIFADLAAGRLPSPERYGGASVRLVERFLTRGFPRVSLGDPSAPVLPGVIPAGDWNPSHGAEPLHQQFMAFLAAQYAPGQPEAAALPAMSAAWEQSPAFTSVSDVRLSPVAPGQAAKAADWRTFIDTGLRFMYAPVNDGHTAFFREYLERTYESIGSLNAAWQLSGSSAWSSFDEVELPGEDDFPAAGARLRDWIGFVSLAVPIRDTAHRFTVLVPTVPGETPIERARRIEIVEALVEREKPAHTDFEVQPFWALFQVGTARLGLDTALGEGARYTAIELGRTAIGEGFLAHGHPWSVTDRAVLGRDAAAEIRT